MGKKIQSQISEWAKNGHDTRLFMHTTLYQPATDLIESEPFYFSVEDKLRTEFNRIDALIKMLAAIREFVPDLIYLRYGAYVYPAHLLMKIAPVVEEINTNDLAQHENLGRIYSLYNRLTRGILLRQVKGLAIVSHELAISKSFSTFNKPVAIISNGIDLNTLTPIAAPKNIRPHIFFIATPGYAWHGTDKLLKFARLFPDLVIEIVGYKVSDINVALPINVRLHGYLKLDEYKRILSRADVSIGTLALHRKRMEEASPLKTRECLAFGIPLIIPYIDTDLNSLQSSFLLQIPNTENNIETHGHEIRDFAYKMMGQRVDRNLISGLIDLTQKEKIRLDFFKHIIENEVLAN